MAQLLWYTEFTYCVQYFQQALARGLDITYNKQEK